MEKKLSIKDWRGAKELAKVPKIINKKTLSDILLILPVAKQKTTYQIISKNDAILSDKDNKNIDIKK